MIPFAALSTVLVLQNPEAGQATQRQIIPVDDKVKRYIPEFEDMNLTQLADALKKAKYDSERLAIMSLMEKRTLLKGKGPTPKEAQLLLIALVTMSHNAPFETPRHAGLLLATAMAKAGFFMILPKDEVLIDQGGQTTGFDAKGELIGYSKDQVKKTFSLDLIRLIVADVHLTPAFSGVDEKDDETPIDPYKLRKGGKVETAAAKLNEALNDIK